MRIQGAFLFLPLIFLPGCDRGGGTVAAGNDAREGVEEDEKIVRESIAEGSQREALAWLGRPDTVLFEGDKQTAFELTRRLIAAGAVSVDIIGVDKIEDGEIAALLAVTLPSKGPQRAAVFAVEAEFLKGSEYTPTPDLDQQYLRITFD